MSANLLTLLGNITLDSGGCPHPFISESLHPYTQGCEFIPDSILIQHTDSVIQISAVVTAQRILWTSQATDPNAASPALSRTG
jgi:hypothetical protein